MLTFDPTQRIEGRCPCSPISIPATLPRRRANTETVPRFDFEFERQLLNAKDLKDLIYEDILLHHFPERQEAYEIEKN
jgi:hypothetical protein